MAPTTGAEEPDLPGMPAAAPLVQHVDPFIGSGGFGYGVGSVFPGPQVPFGFARPGPDTTLPGGLALNYSHCAGYHYDDTEVQGFSQTRMHGTGIVDYGVHAQASAQMTCLVPSAVRNDHVHFIDGSDGGYARAAEAMKARMAARPA